MVVSNDMTHDSRVDRHARTLALAGNQVIVLCRASSSGQAKNERRDFYAVIRFFEPLLALRAMINRTETPDTKRPQDVPLRIATPAKLLRATRRAALMLLDRMWLYRVAFGIRANVYHCNDLDTLDIGAAMKSAGRKLVYDRHELYVEQILPSLLKTMLRTFEGFLVRFAEVVMIVNPFIAYQLRQRYHMGKRVHVVLNCPEAAPEYDKATRRLRGGGSLSWRSLS